MSKIRTGSGQIRRRRDDSLIKNIEREYNVDFGVRGDMKLGQYLEDRGLPSLSKALKMVTRRK